MKHLKHVIGYGATAVIALGIGAVGASGGGSGTASAATTPEPTVTVHDSPAPAATVTDTATATVTAPAKTVTVTAKPKGPSATIGGDGTYAVGKDIKPGTYVSSTPDSGNCYWARLRNTNGDLNSILANNNSAGQSLVTILASDRFFETSGCNTWTRR
ncbi:hypothetical protein [Leekyejoonella antrihumi]|uniref:SH3 domain-containing protein n=1 Tax=Leekyejoonella antrihumi TaxID=1660198 RepID=A0A563E1G2_9MICO|nr:hypothetical protein [Leekyejoonella antrihumi]TWP36368.1 hypothetical protein FGL98_10435 [Leekyejoonella antrihumi]